MKRVFVIGNGESRKGIDLAELNKYGKVYGCNALYRDYEPDALIAIDEQLMHEIYWSGYPIDHVCYFRNWHTLPGEAYEQLTDPTLVTDDGYMSPEMIRSNERGNKTEFVMHAVHRDRMKEAENQTREDDKQLRKSYDLGEEGILTDDVYEILFTKSGFFISWIGEDKVISTDFLPGNTDHAFMSGPLAHLISIVVEEPQEVYFIGMDLYSQTESVNNIYKGTLGYMGDKGNAIPPEDFIWQHGKIMDKFKDVQHFKVNEKHLSEDDLVNREIDVWKVLHNVKYLTYADMFRRLASRAS